LNGEKQNGCFRLLGNKLLHMFSKKLYNTWFWGANSTHFSYLKEKFIPRETGQKAYFTIWSGYIQHIGICFHQIRLPETHKENFILTAISINKGRRKWAHLEPVLPQGEEKNCQPGDQGWPWCSHLGSHQTLHIVAVFQNCESEQVVSTSYVPDCVSYLSFIQSYILMGEATAVPPPLWGTKSSEEQWPAPAQPAGCT
jgi:hypothetical protein